MPLAYELRSLIGLILNLFMKNKRCKILFHPSIPILYDYLEGGISTSEMSYTRQYVAFSDIWADGLGNRDANDFPKMPTSTIAGQYTPNSVPFSPLVVSSSAQANLSTSNIETPLWRCLVQ